MRFYFSSYDVGLTYAIYAVVMGLLIGIPFALNAVTKARPNTAPSRKRKIIKIATITVSAVICLVVFGLVVASLAELLVFVH